MPKTEIYYLLHFVGIFTLFFSFGSLFIGRNYNRAAVIGHGLGLILILLSGFGMQATRIHSFPMWLILKIVIWIIFGGFIVLAKKRIINGFFAWLIIIGLAMSAVYLVTYKPALKFKAQASEKP